MKNTVDYTIHKVGEISPYGDVAGFFYEMTNSDHEDLYGLDFRNWDFFKYARENIIWVCRKKNIIVGCLCARLQPSVWDWDKLVLWQDGLFCKKSSGKAAYLLLKNFIDFGRSEANLVFTCRSKHTNIKSTSLERLGFKKAEEFYLLENT